MNTPKRKKQVYTRRGFPVRKLDEVNPNLVNLYQLLIAEDKPADEAIELVSDLHQEKQLRQKLNAAQQ